ncbi:hypothetical protein Y1Q_0015812 [Alligator mississippiensis]|uniref:Uncharacterized protein n=1 Tax=Alligator mississippiensis TaxID=8496 RepID=A0A151MH41_ALLMI|nr:hypothetical protein Y1Q_0015812 [Alligator mississippiensis]
MVNLGSLKSYDLCPLLLLDVVKVPSLASGYCPPYELAPIHFTCRGGVLNHAKKTQSKGLKNQPMKTLSYYICKVGRASLIHWGKMDR